MAELFWKQPEKREIRWINFENRQGLKGKGGMENRGAKGHFVEPVLANETKVLMDFEGTGVIRHIWVTPSKRDPIMLRSLRIDIYWDGADTPAVSAPLGDFFGVANGVVCDYSNVFFSCPESRAYNSYIHMPFLKHAKVTITNESNTDLWGLIYTIDVCLQKLDPEDVFYFHSSWHRQNSTLLGDDFRILPRVAGAGVYLGANIGVVYNPKLKEFAWWGEGEVNIFLDGDREWPTLVGTGSEDYMCTSWGMTKGVHLYHGCPFIDDTQACFYRFHAHDPIYFHQDCRVTMEQIGCTTAGKLKEKVASGLVNEPEITVVHKGNMEFIKAREHTHPIKLNDSLVADDDALHFLRQDDWCATAYFYLDRPENGLPPLADVLSRVNALPEARTINSHASPI